MFGNMFQKILFIFSMIYELEKIQHRFLNTLEFRDDNKMNNFARDYSIIADKYKVRYIKSFHNYEDLLFLF